MTPISDNLRGGLMMAGAMACFAIEDALIKGMAARVPTGQIILVMGLATTVSFAVLARLRGVPVFGAFVVSRPVLLRNLGETVGAICFVTALVLMPLSVASALFQSLPLAITLGAALFLGETVGWRRWSAILAGFGGVLLILRPFGEGFDLLAGACALGAVACLALRDLASRRVPTGVTSLALSVWGSASFLLAGLLLMVFARQVPVIPQGPDALALAAICVLAVLGYWLMTAATRVGEISAVVPFRYARILFALILGFWLFDETPDAMMIAGMALVVLSGLYTFLRERRLSMADRRR